MSATQGHGICSLRITNPALRSRETQTFQVPKFFLHSYRLSSLNCFIDSQHSQMRFSLGHLIQQLLSRKVSKPNKNQKAITHRYHFEIETCPKLENLSRRLSATALAFSWQIQETKSYFFESHQNTQQET